MKEICILCIFMYSVYKFESLKPFPACLHTPPKIYKPQLFQWSFPESWVTNELCGPSCAARRFYTSSPCWTPNTFNCSIFYGITYFSSKNTSSQKKAAYFPLKKRPCSPFISQFNEYNIIKFTIFMLLSRKGDQHLSFFSSLMHCI